MSFRLRAAALSVFVVLFCHDVRAEVPPDHAMIVFDQKCKISVATVYMREPGNFVPSTKQFATRLRKLPQTLEKHWTKLPPKVDKESSVDKTSRLLIDVLYLETQHELRLTLLEPGVPEHLQVLRSLTTSVDDFDWRDDVIVFTKRAKAACLRRSTKTKAPFSQPTDSWRR